jgi:hypothetical protein
LGSIPRDFPGEFLIFQFIPILEPNYGHEFANSRESPRDTLSNFTASASDPFAFVLPFQNLLVCPDVSGFWHPTIDFRLIRCRTCGEVVSTVHANPRQLGWKRSIQ